MDTVTGDPIKILIADDNPTNLKLLRAILEAYNHEVIEARDGEEALNLLNEGLADAVISDILMPNMDGYRLCYEVRKSELLRSLPFVIYTATYTSPADEKLCLDLGADKYLRKPASALDLLSALGQAIAAPRRLPAIQMTVTEVLKEYSERLVDKLEQKNVELQAKSEEAEAARAQLSGLLAQSPAVLYTLEIEGERRNPILVSDNMLRLLGIAGKDTSYDWWLASLHPADRDRVVRAKQKAVQASGCSLEYRIRHADGIYRWIQDNNRVVCDASGIPKKLVGVWLDVTDRKNAEEALKRSEELFREVLENVELIAVVVDLNSKVTFCNDHLLNLTGWRREEVVGQDYFSIFIPETSQVSRHTFDLIHNGAIPLHHDAQIRTKSGEVKTTAYSADKIQFDGQSCILAVSEDLPDNDKSFNN